MKATHSTGYLLGLLAGANFLHYGNRNVVVTMYDDLRAAFALGNAELGALSSAFMYTHAVATVLLGWFGDRFDRRRVMAVGLIVWSLAAIAGAAATGFWSLMLSRALVGVGTAACVPVANALICDVVPKGGKARSIAIFNLGLFIGGLAGAAGGSLLGFPFGFVAFGAPGLLLAVAIFVVRIPEEHEGPQELEAGPGRFLADAADALRPVAMRWTMLGATLMAFASGGFLAWFYDFLVVEKEATEGMAIALLFVSLFGGLVGVMVGGGIADRWAERVPSGRQRTISTAFVISVPFAVLTIYLPISPLYVALSFLLMFFISWYHGPLAASVDEIAPAGKESTAQGVYIACMHLLGTAPASFVVGEVADRSSIQTALLLPTGAMLLAALAFAASFKSVDRPPVVQTGSE